MYAVNLKQSGTVNFEYYYPDSSIIFEFFVSPWPRGKMGGKDSPRLGFIDRHHQHVWLGIFHSGLPSGENCGQDKLRLQEARRKAEAGEL